MKDKQKEMYNSANTKKQKNAGFYAIIIMLVLIIVASSGIGIYAWAKYQTAVNGTLTGQVAKWSFKLVDGVPETTDLIDFAVTRTDTNTSVAEGRLASGTNGKFEIGIDARGTETILEYVIDVELTNKPTNLKFYADKEKTTEIEVVGSSFKKTGFMSLEDVKEVRTETIYWDWQYITGTTEEEIEANDEIDTQDAGKIMIMAITVTGTEVLEEPTGTQNLADVVSVGQYVNYNATSGKGAGKSYTTEGSLTGSTVTTTFNSSDIMKWKVMSVDKEAGIVELMAEDPTAKTLVLNGKTGYKNAKTVLNDIGAVYGYGDGANRRKKYNNRGCK